MGATHGLPSEVMKPSAITSPVLRLSGRPRRFSGAQEHARELLVAELDQHFRSWADALSDEQVDALYSYCGVSYESVNSYLRGWGSFLIDDARGRALAVKRVRELDLALAGAALPFPLLVYRGVKYPWLAEPEALVGTVIADKGFQSVSLTTDIARKFTGRYHEWDYRQSQQQPAALLEIVLPAGAPAAPAVLAYLDRVPYAKDNLIERELLLARDSHLLVERVSRRGQGMPRLRCRWLGAGEVAAAA